MIDARVSMAEYSSTLHEIETLSGIGETLADEIRSKGFQVARCLLYTPIATVADRLEPVKA